MDVMKLSGDDLDLAVAEYVFGWRWVPMPDEAKEDIMNPAYCKPMFCPPGLEWGIHYSVFRYSHDMDMAMLVRDNIAARLFSHRRAFKICLQILISKRINPSGSILPVEEIIMRVIPEDICRAAVLVSRYDNCEEAINRALHPNGGAGV